MTIPRVRGATLDEIAGIEGAVVVIDLPNSQVRLLGGDPEVDPYAARVRNSDFGRRFVAGSGPSLPAANLELCAVTDRFAFAMPARRDEGGDEVETRRADVERLSGWAAFAR